MKKVFNPFNAYELYDIGTTQTLTCGSYTGKASMVIFENLGGVDNINDISVLGNYSPSGHDASRKVDKNGLAPTVKENHGTVTAILDEQNGYIREDGTVGTITTDGSSPKHNNRVIESENNIRIRKLTPKECFRLMDFDDTDFEKASKVNSDSQLYKQAGNSIVVNCLYLIFKEMM